MSELRGLRYFQCILDDVEVVEVVDTRERYQGDTLEWSYCGNHPVKMQKETEGNECKDKDRLIFTGSFKNQRFCRGKDASLFFITFKWKSHICFSYILTQYKSNKINFMQITIDIIKNFVDYFLPLFIFLFAFFTFLDNKLYNKTILFLH